MSGPRRLDRGVSTRATRAAAFARPESPSGPHHVALSSPLSAAILSKVPFGQMPFFRSSAFIAMLSSASGSK